MESWPCQFQIWIEAKMKCSGGSKVVVVARGGGHGEV